MTKDKVSLIEVARNRLTYDPLTGVMRWKDDPSMPANWRSRFRGKEAGSLAANGYIIVAIGGFLMKGHRLIWAMENNEWPSMHIDHINGVRSDNRMENLRLASPADNARNMAKPRTNTSGVVGVYFFKQTQKWQAKIRVDGIQTHLGLFERFDDAVAARMAAQKAHGYHENHGR